MADQPPAPPADGSNIHSTGTWTPTTTTASTGTPPPPPPSPAGPAPSPQVTPAHVDEAVAKALGMSTADAKKLIKAQQDATKAQMSEAEKARAEAEEEKAKATAAQQGAAKATLEAQLTVALVTAGVAPAKLEYAKRLLGLEPGVSPEAITAAIDQAKKDVPEFFAAGSGAPAGAPPSSNPPGSPPLPKAPGDAKAKAAEIIRQKFPNLVPAPGGNQ